MSISLELNETHADQARARLTFRLKESGNINALIECLVAPFQDIENALQDLYRVQSDVQLATGVYLDNLGYLVGQDREGRVDDVYRLWISARSVVNKATGVPDDFLKVLDILEENAEVTYTCYVAAFKIEAYNITSTPEELFSILVLMKGSGIRMEFEYSTSPTAELFKVGGTVASPVTSSVYGFGSGKLAGLLAT